VLLGAGRALSVDGELPDGFAITAEHLRKRSTGKAPRRPSAAATSFWYAPAG